MHRPQYFDTISAEINDLLQESGQLSVGELAMQYTLNTELVMHTISAHLGGVIKAGHGAPGGLSCMNACM
jgi:hypothetical protein